LAIGRVWLKMPMVVSGLRKDVLNGQRERDDGRFVMLASPQVQVTIG
jgi:hypothetical protein